MLRFALFILLVFAVPQSLQAQDRQSFIDHPVRVCDADPLSTVAPDFSAADCRSTLLYLADPQDQMLWVQITFEPAPLLLTGDGPLGLFLSAKASSEVILNGVMLGTNGRPGPSQDREQAGDMDTVFFVPEGTLQPGKNHLVMKLSSMNGGITLQSPIHNIVLAPYRDPRQPGPATWFAVVTLGLFIAAFVFFGVGALRGHDQKNSALIAIMALMAALQLAAEASRDIVPYPYPLHDLRLTLILMFAVGLALSWSAYILRLLFRPYSKWRWLTLTILAFAMLLIAALQPGFDLKTAYVFLAACLCTGLAGAVAAYQGHRRGMWVIAIALILACAIVWLGGLFLDTALYLIVAAGLLWLFFRRATGSAAVTSEPKAQPSKRIELVSSGKVEFVNTDDIVRFSGAGDYVEVFMRDGRSALYSANLSEVEQELADGFIRVHRSHIVNASFVETLTRASASTGELLLSDGSQVPVSRRNMARVRGSLMSR